MMRRSVWNLSKGTTVFIPLQAFTPTIQKMLPATIKKKFMSTEIIMRSEKLIKQKSALSVHPSVKVAGKLSIKNYDLWKSDEPYTLVSNYVSPFEIDPK